MNYLVTGGAGFIGFWLSKKLSENIENNVYIIDNLLKETDHVSFLELCNCKNVSFINLDLTNSDLSLIPDINFDVVYHLAALNGTQNFYNKPFDVIFNSTLSTLNLLNWFKNKKIGRFVFASTSESYAGAVTLGLVEVPTRETVPLVIENIKNPRWSYASSKINGESTVIAAAIQFDIKYTIIRYHNVYGPRMGVNHIIPDYLNRIKLQNKSELYGAYNTRSFLFVEDAVSDTISLANHKLAINEIINIGSLEEINMLELANKINQILNINNSIEIFDAPDGSVNRRVPNLEFINNILGERKRVSLINGLKNTINYYGF